MDAQRALFFARVFNKKNVIKVVLSVSLIFILSSISVAAEIYTISSISLKNRAIVIEGIIEKGDFNIFIETAKENQGQIDSVLIFTPGGDFYEAMKIGYAVRKLELTTVAPDASNRIFIEYGVKLKDKKNFICASSGFFIYIAGVYRDGYIIGVHRPYFQKGQFGNLNQTDAQIAFNLLQKTSKDYMNEMGVPSHVQDKLLATQSNSIWMLDTNTINTYFHSYAPYRLEWLKNRCSNADKDEENKCWQLTILNSRLEAYERYFEKKTNDTENYDFSVWCNAKNYLNQPFHKILYKEHFEDNKYGEFDNLLRRASIYTPQINLQDSLSKNRVVTSISLNSWINPSPEFIKLLLQNLVQCWGDGKPIRDPNAWIFDNSYFNESKDFSSYHWENQQFNAVLKLKNDYRFNTTHINLEIVAK